MASLDSAALSPSASLASLYHLDTAGWKALRVAAGDCSWVRRAALFADSLGAVRRALGKEATTWRNMLEMCEGVKNARRGDN